MTAQQQQAQPSLQHPLKGLDSSKLEHHLVQHKIFKGMIDRSVEVYVADIVVKSDSCGQHIKDL